MDRPWSFVLVHGPGTVGGVGIAFGHFSRRPMPGSSRLPSAGWRRKRPSQRQLLLLDHINDVIAAVEDEQLSEVVLVGDSYAGMLITAAAEKLRSRLKHLVYVDAAVPGDGDDFASQFPGLSA
jgi:pimeloyl-ACP methyl ester carboxylesterase